MEESLKRRERPQAMRLEVAQSGGGNDVGNSTQTRGLPSPLLETAATNQDSCPQNIKQERLTLQSNNISFWLFYQFILKSSHN